MNEDGGGGEVGENTNWSLATNHLKCFSYKNVIKISTLSAVKFNGFFE